MTDHEYEWIIKTIAATRESDNHNARRANDLAVCCAALLIQGIRLQGNDLDIVEKAASKCGTLQAALMTYVGASGLGEESLCGRGGLLEDNAQDILTALGDERARR